ncbi:transcription factor IIIA [Tanacetum coccineum]
MNRSLFTRIVRDLSANCPYFQEGCDVVGKAGISALVKCTSAIRQLAYAAVPDSLDKYLQIGEKNSGETGIDCTKWSWAQCPQAYHAQLIGKAPEVPFVANDVTYKWGYYLTDEIYPELDVLMKSVLQPGSNDVKRIRYKSLKRITHLMYTCIILHNMIRKEKGKAISPDFYPEEQHREDDPETSFAVAISYPRTCKHYLFTARYLIVEQEYLEIALPRRGGGKWPISNMVICKVYESKNSENTMEIKSIAKMGRKVGSFWHVVGEKKAVGGGFTVKLFECLNENCKKKYSVEGDMMRFVKDKKEHTCLEPGCGKAFKYASKLQKHEESHVKFETVEAFCAEPGCMKYFTNKECLEAHYQQHINCEICGSEQLKQNIKRHLQRHDNVVFKEIEDPMQL